jgi:peptide/nickel transport system permease protein
MGRFLVRRLLGAVGVLLVVSFVTFGLFILPSKISGGSAAYLYVGKVSTPSQIAAVERCFGLDKPFFEQYKDYMVGIVRGRDFCDGSVGGAQHCPAPCFGYSFQFGRPVWQLMMDRLPVTISLAIPAAILWLLAGVSVGVISALKRGTFVDRAAMMTALAGVSLPVFFIGLVLLYVFVYGTFAFLPPPNYEPLSQNPKAWFQSLLLGWITLAFVSAALYARLTRANMLETMGEDYIRTATAKGLKPSRVVGKHGLRAALTPIITIFGLDLGALLGGAIITEKLFSLPGLGLLSIDAIAKQDLPIIMGVTLLGALFIVVANIIVDLVYAVMDPRVRLS